MEQHSWRNNTDAYDDLSNRLQRNVSAQHRRRRRSRRKTSGRFSDDTVLTLPRTVESRTNE